MTEEFGERAICTCGALMRKEELPPAFAYLDFLRTEEEVMNVSWREKES